ncbi:Uncharacterised protein [uncultured Clostridium sp.]|nr:Uncharacterised protein [uncultured Clostridium sp.]
MSFVARFCKRIDLIFTPLIAILLSLYCEMYWEACQTYESGQAFGLLYRTFDQYILLRWFALFLICWAVLYILWKNHRTILHFGYRYRYALGAATLLICVIFSLSGSSIGIWSQTFGVDPSTTGTLFGIPRSIRSDEWGVFTPFTFSQYYNHSGAYPYFSETIRGTITDTAIVYGLPSWDVVTLFRPFLIGHLLLGPARGLAFFWAARFISLFLVSFEFAMLFTKRKKALSFTLAVAITFSSVIQWWFAINGIVELFVFGMGAILAIHHYLISDKWYVRLGLGLILSLCAGGYIMILYPAWQVSMAYVFLAMFIYLLWEHHKEYHLSWKIDLPIIAICIVLLGISLGHVLIQSKETISAVFNTAYPGNRTETGGGGARYLTQYAANLFYPLNSDVPALGPCESAAFMDFFPLGIILALWVIFGEKKRDRMLIPLLIVQLILVAFMCIPFPEFLAKITLLKYVLARRALLPIGFINLLLLIRSLSVITWRPKNNIQGMGLAGLFALIMATACSLCSLSYLGKLYTALVFIILACGGYIILNASRARFQRYLAAFMVLLLVPSGLAVNPVQQGAEAVYDLPIIEQIANISQNDDGLWLVTDMGVTMTAPIMVGAPTINSTNVYPDLERWRVLDPEGKYEEVYNRYAHILVYLTSEPTRFELLQSDMFALHLNFDDLSKLGVKYIMTPIVYEELDTGNVTFTKLAHEGSCLIYQITY